MGDKNWLMATLEATLHQRPDVTQTRRFGLRGFARRREAFVLVTPRGIALSHLSDAETDLVLERYLGQYLTVKGREKEGWLEIPIKDRDALRATIFLVDAAYIASG